MKICSQHTPKVLSEAALKDSEVVRSSADWVCLLSEGAAEFVVRRKRSNLKGEYFNVKTKRTF